MVLLREIKRFVLKHPVMSLSGLLIVALGVGITATVVAQLWSFSALAYPGMQAKGYATVAEATSNGGSTPISWKQYQQVAQALPHSATVAYSEPFSVSVSAAGQKDTASLAAVSENLFHDFTSLAAGRNFTYDQTADFSQNVVILSQRLAAQLYGDPLQALGQSILFNGHPFTVLGVAASSFHGLMGDNSEAWVPAHSLIPLSLPASGLSSAVLAQAWKQLPSFYCLVSAPNLRAASLTSLLRKSLAAWPSSAFLLSISPGITSDPVRDSRLRRQFHLEIWLAVTFLIVSLLNYALLLLARMTRKVDEIKLRRALGAPIHRLVADFTLGPVVTAAMGALLGSIAAWLAFHHLAQTSGFYGQILTHSSNNLLLALGCEIPIVLLLTFLVALGPVVATLRNLETPRMGYATTGSRFSRLAMQIPVVFQITVCIGAWLLAGMVVSSLLTSLRTPLGFQAVDRYAFLLAPGPNGVSFTTKANASFPSASAITAILDRVRAIPGVRSAGLTSSPPFAQGADDTDLLQADDHPNARPVHSGQIMVTQGYFHAMGSHLILGKNVAANAASSDANHAVIDQELAQELWPHENPLGRSFSVTEPAMDGTPSYTFHLIVAGVAQNMLLNGPQSSPTPSFYTTFTGADYTPALVVNSTLPPTEIKQAIAPLVATLIPGLTVQAGVSLNQQLNNVLRPEKKRTLLALADALLMAVLAGIGLLGSLLYSVNARRKELAVRICLGATPWKVRSLVLAQAVKMAALAALLAAPLLVVLSHFALSEYLGRLAWSLPRAALIMLLCVTLATLAALIPAQSAAAVSPSEALKET